MNTTRGTSIPSPSRRKTWTVLCLTLLGLGVSLYQTWHFFALHSGTLGFKSLCNLGKAANCDVIDASSFAELLPGIPLSAVAAGWFFALGCILIASLVGESKRAWIGVATLFSAVGACASIFYLYAMFGVIKTACVLCLTVDAVNFLSFGLLLSMRPFTEGFHFGELSKRALGFGALAAFAAFVAAKGVGVEKVGRNEKLEWLESILVNTAPVDVKTDTETVLGDPRAPVTIVKFSDFQCPACQRGAFALHPALAARGAKVRFVMRNFPLDGSCNRMVKSSMHPAACEAARSVICATRQGKFEAAYERIFEKQPEIVPGKVPELLAGIGIDVDRLKECMGSKETAHALTKDIEEGIRLGVRTTPTFFINGRKVEGGLPPELWIELIDQIAR